jgi:hypothetical protein
MSNADKHMAAAKAIASRNDQYTYLDTIRYARANGICTTVFYNLVEYYRREA